MRRLTVGIDFGGTNVKLGLVTDQGRVALARRVPSTAYRAPAAFIDGMAEAVAALAREARVRLRALRGVGIGAPGPIDARRQAVSQLVNVPGWRDVPLARLLARRLRCRCVVENDANCFALGERRFGAGRGSRHMIGVTLGTGVGGGLVLDGALYRGAIGAAGEIGHMVANPRGPRCGCGARGCLEAMIGTAPLLALGRDALRRGSPQLARLARAHGGRLTPELIARAASAGDAACRRIWDLFGGWLGSGIASLLNALDPDRVVIGGGVANAWPLFHREMRAAIRRQALPRSRAAAQVVRGSLGSEAGLVGAAVALWGAQEETGSRHSPSAMLE